MAWAAALAEPPFQTLDPDVRDFACRALEELGEEARLDEVTDVLAPFLLDAGLAADDAGAMELCAKLAAPMATPTVGEADNTAPKVSPGKPPVILGAVAGGLSPAWDQDDFAPLGMLEKNGIVPEVAPSEVFTSSKGRAATARGRAAAKDAAARALAASPDSAFELDGTSADGVANGIARLLRAEIPSTAGATKAGEGSEYLASSFEAYAAERPPGPLQHWQALLAEVLSDAGIQLDEDDPHGQVAKVVDQMVRRGLLKLKERSLEVGDQVLAVLEEDDDWHPAVIDAVNEDGTLAITFLEYAKPQAVMAASVRQMEDVVDDDVGADTEGDCEMCARHRLLTFHHLIPKDTHSRYLGKRLPHGVDGEPTRHFLNSHGTMICRQCHNMVHKTETNDVLAAEYNTLQRLLDHPTIQRWVQWARSQTGSSKRVR